MKLSTRVPAGSVLLLLLAACGGSDEADVAGPVVPVAELPAAYASAICDAFENCAGPLLDVYLPGEDCSARVTAQLEEELGRIEEAIDGGLVTYHGDRIKACTDELRAKTCSELLDRDSPLCLAGVDGTVEVGAACSMSIECKGRAYCNFTDACPGVCAELEPAGAACRSDGNCASGLVCSKVTSHCVKPAGPGAPCEAGEPECAPGFACAGADDDEDRPGTCRAYEEMLSIADGQSCDPVAGELCDSTLACVIESADLSGITAICAPNVASGAACKAAFPDQCPDPEYCEMPLGSLEGSCVPRPGLGQPCGLGPFATVGSICAANLRCNGSTCRELATLGESCSAGDACLSERCLDGVCVSGDSCE